MLAVAYSPDGKTLATAAADGSLILWEKAKPRTTLHPAKESLRWLQFSGDGRLLAAQGVRSGKVYLLNAASGKTLRTQIFETHHSLKMDPGRTAAGSTQPRRQAAGDTCTGKDGIALWDTSDGKVQRLLKNLPQGLLALAFSPDGRRLAAAAEERTLKVWDVPTGRELPELEPDLPRQPTVLAFSADGNLLAVGSVEGLIALWDMTTHQERLLLRKGAGLLTAVTLTRTGVRWRQPWSVATLTNKWSAKCTLECPTWL